MYAIGTSGPVEFIIIGFVEIGSAAAENRAVRDTSYIVPHFVTRIADALNPARSISTPRPSPKPTSTAVPSHTHAVPTPTSKTSNRTLTIIMNGHTWRLTLTRVVVAQKVHDDYDSYAAQGKFVLVFLTAQNLDKHPQDLNYDENFTLVDSQGRVFSLANNGGGTAVNQYNADDPSTNVQPTFLIHTVFLFDVAADAKGLSLHNAESDGSNARMLFGLGI